MKLWSLLSRGEEVEDPDGNYVTCGEAAAKNAKRDARIGALEAMLGRVTDLLHNAHRGQGLLSPDEVNEALALLEKKQRPESKRTIAFSWLSKEGSS